MWHTIKKDQSALLDRQKVSRLRRRFLATLNRRIADRTRDTKESLVPAQIVLQCLRAAEPHACCGVGDGDGNGPEGARRVIWARARPVARPIAKIVAPAKRMSICLSSPLMHGEAIMVEYLILFNCEFARSSYVKCKCVIFFLSPKRRSKRPRLIAGQVRR
jgi:hypothetical protein